MLHKLRIILNQNKKFAFTMSIHLEIRMCPQYTDGRSALSFSMFRCLVEHENGVKTLIWH